MKRVRWLTEHEQQVWRRFAAVLGYVPAELEAQLQHDSQMTHFGYWVMAVLSEAPQRAMRMSELAAMAHGSQSRLSHVVAKLEQRGWVRRERVADDGRGCVAVLTESGYDQVVASAPGHVEAVRSMVFDALSSEQLDQLGDICTAILANAPRGRQASALDRAAAVPPGSDAARPSANRSTNGHSTGSSV